MRGVGQHEHVPVRRDDGQVVQGDLAGWDPATQLAVLRAPGLGLSPIVRADADARVGHLALAIARSWSNAVTATAGLVSVIGGPLSTGRRRAIDQVIRTSAPMHEGFSGGAFVDTEGRLLGVATAISIRGLGVVIPAGTAWTAAAALLEHGSLKRGYLGIAAQPVSVPDQQRRASADLAGRAPRSAGRRPRVASGDSPGDSRGAACLGAGHGRRTTLMCRPTAQKTRGRAPRPGRMPRSGGTGH